MRNDGEAAAAPFRLRQGFGGQATAAQSSAFAEASADGPSPSLGGAESGGGDSGAWRPARDENGRFLPGQGGRPLGARNRASARVSRLILRDFEREAQTLLPTLRRWFMPQYLALVGRLLPRGVEDAELEGLSEADAAAMLADMRAAVAALEAGERPHD